MLTLSEVPYDRVAPFAALAAKEGASVKDTPTTRWWAVCTPSGSVLAFAGVLFAMRLARLKAAWTRPDERGMGHGLALVRHRLEVCESTPGLETIEVIQVHSGDPEFWTRLGFTLRSTRPNGGRVYQKSVARG